MGYSNQQAVIAFLEVRSVLSRHSAVPGCAHHSQSSKRSAFQMQTQSI